MFACAVRAESACKHFTRLLYQMNIVFVCEVWPGQGEGKGWIGQERVNHEEREGVRE